MSLIPPDDLDSLARFVSAQADVYPQVLRELADGRKQTHWMWFIFPQVAGLGSSSTAKYYAIHSVEEGRAYLDHSVLGHRLAECTDAVLRKRDTPMVQLFGTVDALTFRSSMTLFSLLAGPGSIYQRALKYTRRPVSITLPFKRTQN